MNGQDMLNALNYVNLDYVKEAEEYTGRRKIRVLEWAGAAACFVLCVAAIGGVHGNNSTTAETQSISVPEQAEKVELITREEHATPARSYVNYNDLNLPTPEESIAFNEGTENTDIAPFEESFLSEHSAIYEGTVTNMYVKHYEYDVYDDKFEEDGILHMTCDTLVYELAVDRTWFGEDMSGKTVKIEDNNYYRSESICGEAFEIRTGMRYVIPVYEYGEEISLYRNFAGGDKWRDSNLATLYPFHPQIVVTEDEEYIVSSDWPTLIEKNAVPVIIDGNDWYSDKMYLVDGESFEQQMLKLIENIE